MRCESYLLTFKKYGLGEFVEETLVQRGIEELLCGGDLVVGVANAAGEGHAYILSLLDRFAVSIRHGPTDERRDDLLILVDCSDATTQERQNKGARDLSSADRASVFVADDYAQ